MSDRGQEPNQCLPQSYKKVGEFASSKFNFLFLNTFLYKQEKKKLRNRLLHHIGGDGTELEYMSMYKNWVNDDRIYFERLFFLANRGNRNNE